MKKIITLMIAVITVASSFAAVTVKKVSRGEKVAPAVTRVAQQRVKVSQLVTAPVKSDVKSKAIVKAPTRNAAEDYTWADSAYVFPTGTFFAGLFSENGEWGYNYTFPSCIIPPGVEVEFAASSLGDNWEYFLSGWDDEAEIATGKTLKGTFNYDGATSYADAPYLTQHGDSIFQANYAVHYGGSGSMFSSADGEFSEMLGFHDVNDPDFDLSPVLALLKKDAYADGDAFWTKQSAEELGVDNLVVTGCGEFISKPVAPLTLSKVNFATLLAGSKGATMSCLVLPVNDGVVDLENPLATGECKLEKDYPVTDGSLNVYEASFELMHLDAEGLESNEPILIDQDVVVVINFDDDRFEYMRPYGWFRNEQPSLNPVGVTMLNGFVGGEQTGTFIQSNAFKYTDGSVLVGACLTYDFAYQQLVPDAESYAIPAEGGEVEANFISTVPADEWYLGEAPDYEIPEWLSVQSTDYVFHYSNVTDVDLYAGERKLTFSADALPEGETGRSFDLRITFPGMDKVIRITQGEVAPEFAKGDVNGDGAVGAADIACLVNVLAGLEDEAKYEGRADVTGDGAVSAADIAAIVNILAGLE